jgi:uncharacterized protein YkwD
MKKLYFVIIILISPYSYSNEECGLHPKAQEFAKLLMNSSIQKHPNLTCNKRLAEAAAHKAKLMAENKRVDHFLDYQSPNQLLRSYGLVLPRIYELIGNQVEAISGGKKTAKSAFEYFLTSPPHKAHILGEGEFYKTQSEMAVGYYYDYQTPHEHYWVVYVTGLDDDKITDFKGVVPIK